MKLPSILCLLTLLASGWDELEATEIDPTEAEIEINTRESRSGPKPIRLVAYADAKGDPRVPPRSAAPAGRAVARVGSEVITLPELTAVVKARLAEVPDDQVLDRRQTIVLAKAVYKVMVVRPLVFQEARDVLGGPVSLDSMVKGLERQWVDRELPELIRREGSGSGAGLRSKLARRSTTPGLLRDEFIIRSVAENLRNRESPLADLASYLEGVRRRRPIVQIMTEAELNDAGRDAAIEARRRR